MASRSLSSAATFRLRSTALRGEATESAEADADADADAVAEEGDLESERACAGFAGAAVAGAAAAGDEMSLPGGEMADETAEEAFGELARL